MQTIKLFQNESYLVDLKTFILIKPTNFIYKVGHRYHFINDNVTYNYLGRKFLKCKQDYLLKSLPEDFIWLSKNCNKKQFLEIQQNVFNSNLTDSFSVLIFSSVETPEFIKLQQDILSKKY